MPIAPLTQPLVFEPLFMQRIWGGRRLETHYRKRLPPGERIGESWEIVDREEAQSVVHEGPLRGTTLHELWSNERETAFGTNLPDTARFPLLFKILDAQDRLSVQVHPPAHVAAELGGEPKTEMWYVLESTPGAEIFAGLKANVGRDEFEKALPEGRVAELVNRVAVRPGDAVFIPSGRIHAIGAGNLVLEVQQNSDTTYRVFDWNRVGLDGRERTLHIDESLRSIDFHDHQPAVSSATRGEIVAECEYFRVAKWKISTPRLAITGNFAVFTVLDGKVKCAERAFEPGEFFVVPACLPNAQLVPMNGGATVLCTTIPPRS
jgi:mannose-6-phosphate isomerase